MSVLRTSDATSVLARGAGRSYGDTALNEGGCIIRTTRMRTIHAFDATTGEAVLDPGVTFGDLLHRFSSLGWIAPVTPGTQFATIGGAIANDVHGKNHDADGSLGEHVQWFDLALPGGKIQRVDPFGTPDLFAATIGGIGLTGVIVRVCLRMKRIPSTMLLVRERRIGNLEDYLTALQDARATSQYTVGWIDGVAKGSSLGRGIFETAEHIDDKRRVAPRKRLRMPFDLPAKTINTFTVGVFNRLYYERIARGGRERKIDLERFFYPLDSILEWNRIYGRRGFVQFQCVIPDADAPQALRRLLAMISDTGRASFLAVIKTLGHAGPGHLSFPIRGITLALDFPVSQGIGDLMSKLHATTIEHGGRVYLAKDSHVSPKELEQMYPRVHDFRAVVRQVDPERRLGSDMARRLQL